VIIEDGLKMSQKNARLTFKELRRTRKSTVIKEIDYHLSGLPLDQKSLEVAKMYNDELVRRSTDRATRWLIFLTVIIAILTLILVLDLADQYFKWIPHT
jgi:hypothetical protein